MAWEATHLLPLVLLVLLASGSWEQQPEPVSRLEGERILVRCAYPPQKRLKTKVWCKRTSARLCTLLVTTSSRLPPGPRGPSYFISDDPWSGHFLVTMTELRVSDSGFYWCGTYESSKVFVLRNIHLLVSRASVPPTTRRTTAWTSATSPATDSVSGPGILVPSVTATVLLLLLLLGLLLTLYLIKVRGRARPGQDKSHCTGDISVHEEETVYREDPSRRQRASQLSWGSNQQMGSGEDSGDIHYATLTHLNCSGLEDCIYINTRPSWKPAPDPYLTVEYASIAKNRTQRSGLAALAEGPQI